jgi:hypothetical protein
LRFGNFVAEDEVPAPAWRSITFAMARSMSGIAGPTLLEMRQSIPSESVPPLRAREISDAGTPARRANSAAVS